MKFNFVTSIWCADSAAMHRTTDFFVFQPNDGDDD